MNVLRDLSLILLAVEAFVLALMPVALFGGLVYGLWWLNRHDNLPSWLKLVQAYLSLGRAYIELAMRVVIRPILFVHSVLAMVRVWLDAIAMSARGRR